MTALAQDIGQMFEKEKTDVASQLIKAARDSGRSPISMALDFFKLRRGRGKIMFFEYMLYELYDTERYSEAERQAFVSSHMHGPLVNECNDRNWWAVTEDKWLSAVFLEQNGMPIPKTEAVFDSSARHYGKEIKLTDAATLKTFLTGLKDYPLFGKPIGGIWSAGVLRITGCTDTHVLMDGREAMTFEELVTDVIGDQTYIFQECLKPHKFFDGITDATATVRSLNVLEDNTLNVTHTLLKLPRQGNIADNFWRAGNVLCDIDTRSGEVRGLVAVQNGRRVVLDGLPDSDRTLIGETLPHWEELCELNKRVALLHAANPFGSTDIALTKDGPVVVEVNNGCALELIQIATGQGFLNEDMTRFFRGHGAKI